MQYTALKCVIYTLLTSAAQANVIAKPPAKHLGSRGDVGEIVSCVMQTGSDQATLAVHDVAGNWRWSWTGQNATQQGIPQDLQKCINDNSFWFQDAKWIRQGEAIVTIYHHAALMINHLPGHPDDGKIVWGTCINRDNMGSSHTLEILPAHHIAIATTSGSATSNIQIFKTDTSNPLDPYAKPVQSLNGIAVSHGLLWDRTDTQLWAVGNNINPERKDSNYVDSAPTLAKWRWDDKKQLFGSSEPTKTYRISQPRALTEEWWPVSGSYWWDGAHDITGVPNQRKLLIAVDADLHSFDITTEKFETGDSVANKYFGGFRPNGDRQNIPRSDVKGISLDANGNVVYTQASWKSGLGYQYTVLSGGQFYTTVRFHGGNAAIYKARFFSDVPGWPKART
ncbi:hypothetical protein VHEMI04354 [[Torrubiella] hemipterigena]|uniref:Uncharacterized protein n=1 Tax=[Torrubiella] hemipterigena TaxID=1531966 RepID=A0A0A1T100_9HYPO|nr:hypothetical protein VHEMI04354 [[Torrubiella] hemipterigena]